MDKSQGEVLSERKEKKREKRDGGYLPIYPSQMGKPEPGRERKRKRGGGVGVQLCWCPLYFSPILQRGGVRCKRGRGGKGKGRRGRSDAHFRITRHWTRKIIFKQEESGRREKMESGRTCCSFPQTLSFFLPSLSN